MSSGHNKVSVSELSRLLCTEEPAAAARRVTILKDLVFYKVILEHFN